MIDGGFKEGTDVFKALGLGAKFIFFGRPALWGLSVSGQQGVENVLNIFKQELNLTMALSGVTKIEQITKDYILPVRSKL